MADTERLKSTPEQIKDHELEQIRREQHEKLQHANPEKVGEKNRESVEAMSSRAAEYAKSREKDLLHTRPEQENATKERRRDGIVSKKERAANYKRTMAQVQKELPLVNRTFSKIIHTKAVERTSDALGSTVARPNAILAGSFTAFIFTLGIFLIARYYGYPLSGTETIAAFVLGWMAGLLFDYLRLEFTGGKS